MRRAAALFAVLALGTVARAEFVRGTIKVDVRDQAGAPVDAQVTVSPLAGGEARTAVKTGQVYVVDGLVEGDFVVEAPGAATERARVSGHRTVGVVLMVGAPKKKHAPSLSIGLDEPACDVGDGAVVEAIAFARGQLGAGRLEVRSTHGKLLCVAGIAGGGATLRLKPGDYQLSARFAGGGTARDFYRIVRDRPPPPLTLRAK